MATADSELRARVVILGACGFIGRHLVKFLIDTKQCSYIRAVDKTRPEIAAFSPEHSSAFQSPLVEYVQADLTRDAHISKALNVEKGSFDYVFNLAGETKYGMEEDIYRTRCRDLSIKCGKAASEMIPGLKKYVEVSTAQVYKSQSKSPSKESNDLGPWTRQARFKLQAEQELQKLPNLPLVILRPAVVYGPGDVSGLMPRIVCAASYQKLNEKMKFLWDEQMRLNTVHVRDVVNALWVSACQGSAGSVYNLADKSDTDQGKLNLILGKLFGIKTGFQGKLISNLARLSLTDVVDEANEKHLRPWVELCKIHSITNTPLSPYIDGELLSYSHLCIDGSAIESVGFRYNHPEITEELIREEIEAAISQHLFPPVLAE